MFFRYHGILFREKSVIRLVEPAGNDPASGEVRFGFNPRRNLSRPRCFLSSHSIKLSRYVFFQGYSLFCVFFCVLDTVEIVFLRYAFRKRLKQKIAVTNTISPPRM